MQARGEPFAGSPLAWDSIGRVKLQIHLDPEHAALANPQRNHLLDNRMQPSRINTFNSLDGMKIDAASPPHEQAQSLGA
ncbi:hypothetical protein A176_004123 [Myxococcus hansupus]|uniref:Uncharacterized protein n=1 Tax=Pseudomyxococcus hansupus TaxID=1297742 RepID=A0A0H4WUW3_9BACT|nr:hypothetical protein A176_004123 [Myxococcus hansupus]